MRSEEQNEALLLDALTDRELEILRLIAQGLSNREIAQELVLAPETVKWYNKQLFDKLDAHSRTHAVARANELGLLNASSGAIPSGKYNLPAEVTSFVGRAREVAELGRLLERARLLTITGLGGSGKTRLALHTASTHLDDFPDGVCFVPLASIPTAGAMLWAIGAYITFRFHPSREPLEQLVDYFRNKRLLLVLDNLDHLVSGAELITEILRAAPGVKILATSRERLNLYGEVSYPIAGLALPGIDDVNEISSSESVELFLERARNISPNLEWKADDLQQVVRICRVVEGMPLGIELAATWVDTLSAEEIADEIECSLDILETEHQNVPYSQHSMRAVFNRSWELLDDVQQRAFQSLVVFRGGFTREAAHVITKVSLRTLQALVNKSLVRRLQYTGRYDIHELLRHYAQERLELSGEAEAVHEAHATYFADFLAARWLCLKDRRQKQALLELEADIENARAAWRYWIEAQSIAQLKKFLHPFWAIYDIRGWYSAGTELFGQAVPVMQATASEEAAAILGWLLAVQGLYYVPGQSHDRAPEATPSVLAAHGVYSARGYSRHGFTLAQQGVDILKGLHQYEDMLIIPLISLFTTASQLNEEQEVSFQAASECLEVATQIGDQWAIAKAKQFLTVMAIENGEYQRAERLAYETLAAFEANGDSWSISVVCIEVFGLLAITLRQYQTAREWIQRGLKAAEEIDFKYSIQTAYWQFGFVAALEENYQEAGRYWHLAQQVSGLTLGGSSFIGFGRVSSESGGVKP